MPVYEYSHVAKGCAIGKVFEVEHPISEKALTKCPKCGKKVKRLISRTFLNTPSGDAKLKEMGFTKLVRRDKGVYENVTALEGESRFMEDGKPETMPDLKRRKLE